MNDGARGEAQTYVGSLDNVCKVVYSKSVALLLCSPLCLVIVSGARILVPT